MSRKKSRAKFGPLRTVVVAALLLITGGVLDQTAEASDAPSASSEEFARALVSNSDVLLSAADLYLVAADLFARSYFMDLRPYPSWGPNDARWATQYPLFLKTILANSLPMDTSLEVFLTSVLAQRMSSQELLELGAKFSHPRLRAAIGRLEGLGLNYRFMLLAERKPDVLRLYSSADQQAANRTIAVMRGALPEIERLKPDLELLHELLQSRAFLRYQTVVSESFMETVGKLEGDKGRFTRLMAIWKDVVAEPGR
jgi:hypothetical protein